MVVAKVTAVPIEELIKKHSDVDPFLIKKWERIFSLFFDRNASHQVDWGDFYLVVKKVRDIYGAESVQTDFAKKSLAALWEGLCSIADADKDQLISIDEWIGLLKKTNAQTEPKWFKDYQNFMFKLFDVSCDGVMDLAEYTDGMNTYGFDQSECDAAFHKFSVDKKGQYVPQMKPETWNTYFHQLFYSTNKADLGNHLFGIIDF
ncbi:hypothetical protein L5515_014741 [Caenorhabditis briggsae]|uniref:EF-hand domain-containing protein n=1 Tax=Caenorhabditis briggsae TaxID=6238 RepID=A0AAE9ECR4_CAEBR|nr:hypothetical protein L5515_014741 [Caenorhabditis briggsae]